MATFRSVLVGVVFVALACLVNGAETYRNPVIDDNLANPAVIEHGGTYYLYATGEVEGDNGYRVYTSDELVNWKRGPVVFRPGQPHIWAPDSWRRLRKYLQTFKLAVVYALIWQTSAVAKCVVEDRGLRPRSLLAMAGPAVALSVRAEDALADRLSRAGNVRCKFPEDSSCNLRIEAARPRDHIEKNAYLRQFATQP